MHTVFLICAAVGGTVLVLQTIALVFGGGGADDVDFDGQADGLDHAGDSADLAFKVLSIKTLTAFLTFFGLAGLAGESRGWQTTTSMLVALGAGSVALFAVGYVMAGLHKLQSRGNVDLANAIGKQARVHLRVPGAHSGRGKVLVLVQGRKLECKAVTGGDEIPTGAEVTVVAAPAADTVEVQLLR